MAATLRPRWVGIFSAWLMPVFYLYFARKVAFAGRGIEMLDGVAESRARHGLVVLGQIIDEHSAVALADFAQHPAGGFVNEVVLVGQKLSNDAQWPLEIA